MVEEGEDVSAFESFSTEDAAVTSLSLSICPKEETSESRRPSSSSSSTALCTKKNRLLTTGTSLPRQLERHLERQPPLLLQPRSLALEKGIPLSRSGTGPGGKSQGGY